MKAIAAVDNNFGIGKDGKLLFHIKEDMQFFKRMTTGKVVVMGRKTFESLPNGPLKDRLNLVITHEPKESYDNVIFGTMNEIIDEINKHDTDDVFIIGGESIYNFFFDNCDIIYLTRVNISCEADKFFPPIYMYDSFAPVELIDSGITENGIHWQIEKWI